MARKKTSWPPKVGTKFRDLYGDLCHVRAVVDGQVVYRFWMRHKQRWRYKIEDRYFFETCVKENRSKWKW